MQDFNLRPEIIGFGRPERALATPAPTLLPADQWKPFGKDFEVNGLGQLRTVLALPPTQEQCMCDNCVASRQGRFQPLPGDDPRPLVEQVKAQHPELVAPAPKSPSEQRFAGYAARYGAMGHSEFLASGRRPPECPEDLRAYNAERKARRL